MRKIFTICVAALLIGGCAQKDPFEELADGTCTSAQADSVTKHISGQIDALAQNDWELAYSFASADFQSGVSLDDFTQIINAQYLMLTENQGYQFSDCTVSESTIAQVVSVTSDEQVFSLTYKLTVKDSALGVESAVISEVVSQVNI